MLQQLYFEETYSLKTCLDRQFFSVFSLFFSVLSFFFLLIIKTFKFTWEIQLFLGDSKVDIMESLLFAID